MNMNCNLTEIQNILSEIKPLLKDNTMLYIVGGYLRDKFFNKESLDIDFIVVNQNAIELAREFANETGRYFVLLDEVNEIARVVDKDKLHFFDFARCINDNIDDDIKRRDLTVNTLVEKVFPEFKSIDKYNAIEDLRNKIIRMTDEKNLIDDPLRILRVFRFASILDFDIDKDTLSAVKTYYHLINNIAQERILAELLKLFEGKNSAKYINLMKETGLLYEILDILEAQENIPPNTHHHLKLIDHSIETVHQVELKIPNAPEFVQEKLNSYQSNGIKYLSLLKLSCLLHDVGKPSTWTIEENGRHRFINHDSVGADLLKPYLAKKKFSKSQIKYITTLVKYHIYPSQLAGEVDINSDKPINRMFRKLGEFLPDIILLAMGDRLSAQGPAITREITDNNINTLSKYLIMYKEFCETSKPLEKLLNGNEIASILNIEKNEYLGEVVKKLHEAQLSGEVNSKEDAIKFIEAMK